MIRKGAVLNENRVTDTRFLKVFNGLSEQRVVHTGMIYRNSVNACEVNTCNWYEMYAREDVEMPANSMKFVSVTTKGKLFLPLRNDQVLLMEPEEREEVNVLLVPGVSQIKEKKAYCCLINPEMHRKKIRLGDRLGRISVISGDEVMSTQAEGDEDEIKNPTEELYRQIIKDLKISENEVMRDSPKMKKSIIQLFQKYSDIISRP